MRALPWTALAAVAALAWATPSLAAPSPPSLFPGAIQAPIKTISGSGAHLQIALGDPATSVNLSVQDATERSKLSHAEPTDVVKLEVDDVTNPTHVTKVDQVSRPIGAGPVALALSLSMVVLFSIVCLVTLGKPQSFLIGVDNRYSNSQCQLALWFGAVAIVYAAAVGLRVAWLGWDFVGGVGVTSNVMAITGLSALSFGGAKVITTQQVADAAANGQPPKTTAAKPDLLRNLIQDDSGRADLGDFQMILITLVAVLIFLIASFHFLTALSLESPTTLPDLDSTLLSGFGLGQGAYLLKKAASPLGQG